MPSEISAFARDFFTADEAALGERFLKDGYVIIDAEDKDALLRLRAHLAAASALALGLGEAAAEPRLLDDFAAHCEPANVNKVRLDIINRFNGETWVRPAYFRLARRALEILVGNELAMQRRINLSIQMPRDTTSVLPIHADVWSGDSPYEVVLWVPFVDCFATKSMYILDPRTNADIHENFADWGKRNAEELFKGVSNRVTFLEIPFGKVLLFSQNLLHGNRENVEATTRFSTNCRFKSCLSPYADKRLGEFFEPITLRPATRLGTAYRLPRTTSTPQEPA